MLPIAWIITGPQLKFISLGVLADGLASNDDDDNEHGQQHQNTANCHRYHRTVTHKCEFFFYCNVIAQLFYLFRCHTALRRIQVCFCFFRVFITRQSSDRHRIYLRNLLVSVTGFSIFFFIKFYLCVWWRCNRFELRTFAVFLQFIDLSSIDWVQPQFLHFHIGLMVLLPHLCGDDAIKKFTSSDSSLFFLWINTFVFVFFIFYFYYLSRCGMLLSMILQFFRWE